jgi:hypothetical protein
MKAFVSLASRSRFASSVLAPKPSRIQLNHERAWSLLIPGITEELPRLRSDLAEFHERSTPRSNRDYEQDRCRKSCGNSSRLTNQCSGLAASRAESAAPQADPCTAPIKQDSCQSTELVSMAMPAPAQVLIGPGPASNWNGSVLFRSESPTDFFGTRHNGAR